ncbi:disease resistance protein RPV1-like [Hevea brasiliensis]|uniref:disease resistance protein RPV1-like n=1 Tax=Hevea brasiliensis TaxID=3981 RepID=UPI0025FD0DAE|nr:disease resistance protein RPV1-like [Hevea brasiliensis]
MATVIGNFVVVDDNGDGDGGNGDGDSCGSGGGGGGGDDDGDSVVVLVDGGCSSASNSSSDGGCTKQNYQILMASSSSSSSSINPQWKKYDAFISFRGADIREGFLSDLPKSKLNSIQLSLYLKNLRSATWILFLHSKLIEEIVNDVGKKLNHLFPSVYDEDGFVGIDSRVKEVESLLCLESEDVLMIGIWGMGGISRTTIADKVCNGIANKFESRCFIANVREELEKRTPVQLRDEILGKILEGENFYVGTPCTLHPFIKRSLHNRRVLIVLDEVDDYLHLTDLVGGWNLYGPGSRVIVTSRDKQVLEIVDCKKCIIYKVEKLNDCESLRLFSLHAFKQPHPAEGYMKQLSEKVISYTQGVPLALKVLGCNLLCGIRSLLDKSLVTISGKKSSQLKQLWTEDAPFIENLKFMDLSNSKQLIRIPDPLKFPKLEVVILRVWLKFLRLLTLLPSGLGEFRCVEYPNLIGCSKLKSLPNSICNLKSLKRLDISHCVNLHGLPENLGDLESLENLIATRSGLACLYYLSLQGCGISEIPTLEWLDAENCTSLEFVSSTFIQGYMNSYLDLDLSKCINLDQSSSMDCLLLKLQSMGPPEV